MTIFLLSKSKSTSRLIAGLQTAKIDLAKRRKTMSLILISTPVVVKVQKRKAKKAESVHSDR